MLKKIIGIVLVVIGAGLGFLLFRDDGDKLKASMMKDAVYAENGKVLPANEGKVVIVPGKPVMLERAVDKDLNLAFNTPFIKRHLQIYKNVGSASERKMRWTTPTSVKRGNVKISNNTNFYGSLKIGDFIIGGTFLANLGTSPFTNFSESAARRLGFKIQDDAGNQYLTEALVKDLDSFTYEGRIRIRYDYLDMNKVGEKTFVGIQKGNRLLFKDDTFTGEIHDGILVKDRVLQNSGSNSTAGNIFGYFCCALMIAGGAYLVVRSD